MNVDHQPILVNATENYLKLGYLNGRMWVVLNDEWPVLHATNEEAAPPRGQHRAYEQVRFARSDRTQIFDGSSYIRFTFIRAATPLKTISHRSSNLYDAR